MAPTLAAARAAFTPKEVVPHWGGPAAELAPTLYPAT